MAIEPARGCGYRKAGGYYLVSAPGIGEPCDRLPIPLSPCSCCGLAPLEQTRGTQWVGASYVFGKALPCVKGNEADKDPGHHGRCVLCNEKIIAETGNPPDRFLVLWIGKEHYETPADWTKEANELGASRRVPAPPKDLVPGQTWILVAHPAACEDYCRSCDGKGFVPISLEQAEKCKICDGKPKWKVPGIFHGFRPRAIELVVTPSMKKQKWVKDAVAKHKVELVEVPEDDPDHAPPAPKKSARKRAMEKHARKHVKRKEKVGG